MQTPAPSPVGPSFSPDTCEALNPARNRDMHRSHQITRAVMCDTRPAACVTEMLFAHELYWQTAPPGGTKCARWKRDGDWPTIDPHLSRAALNGGEPSGIWETVLSAMPNQTLWLHGDSITTQSCEAAFCSLARSDVIPRQPLLCTKGARHPATPPCTAIDTLAETTGMQLRAARLPNGATLLCSAVGVFERETVAAVLEQVDVVIINYGLHYHQRSVFRQMLGELFTTLQGWAEARRGRVPLYRENSAQHFKGGAWRPGAHKPAPGAPCECEQLGARSAADQHERAWDNQNVEFNGVAAREAARCAND